MKPVSVLLVDDNTTFLHILKRFLQTCCSQEVTVVDVALSGQEALTQAQKLQPQIILLDMMMPDMFGLEIIPSLRAIVPNVRVIILTMYGLKEYQEAAVAAGADEFVVKTKLNTDLMPAIWRVFQTGVAKMS